MMIKYSDEKKNEAIQSMAEKGVKKTHEETGISIQTLYKWRNESADVKAAPRARKLKLQNSEVAKLINDGEYQDAKIKALEAEVATLREKNAALKKALALLID